MTNVIPNNHFDSNNNRSTLPTSLLVTAGDTDVDNQYSNMFCMVVVKGSWFARGSKVTEKLARWDFPLRLE